MTEYIVLIIIIGYQSTINENPKKIASFGYVHPIIVLAIQEEQSLHSLQMNLCINL